MIELELVFNNNTTIFLHHCKNYAFQYNVEIDRFKLSIENRYYDNHTFISTFGHSIITDISKFRAKLSFGDLTNQFNFDLHLKVEKLLFNFKS